MKTVFHVFFFSFFSLLLVFFSNGAAAELENRMTARDDFVRTAGYGEEKLSSVLVTGSVLCQPRFHGEDAVQTRAWNVAGASVAITCKIGRKIRKMNWAVGTTDEYGVFIIDLPSHLHAIQKLGEACMVRLLRLPKNSACWAQSGPKAIQLTSVRKGVRIFTAGPISLQPKSKPSRGCLKKARDTGEGQRSC